MSAEVSLRAERDKLRESIGLMAARIEELEKREQWFSDGIRKLDMDREQLRAENTRLRRKGKPDVADCMDPWECCVHTPEEAEACAALGDR